MAQNPAMPFFWAEFFSDTEDMRPDEAKAYLFLLGHAWLRKARLPNDDGALARLARVSPKAWSGMKSTVMAKWELDGGGYWRQKRLTKEWDFVCRKREVNSKNGALGGKSTQSKKSNEINESIQANAQAPTPTPTVSKERPSSEGLKKGPLDEVGRSQKPAPRRQGSGAATNQQPLAEAKPAKPDKRRMPSTARLPGEWIDFARTAGASAQEAGELAEDFVGYWSDRTDAKAAKSSSGWKRTWRNHVRDVAARRRWGSSNQRRPGWISTEQAGKDAADEVVRILRERGELAPDEGVDAYETQPGGQRDQRRDFQGVDGGIGSRSDWAGDDAFEADPGNLLVFPKLERFL